jgi:hypothetical protein
MNPSCIHAPTSLEAAEAIIACAAGTTEWRPLMLLGLGTVALIAVAVVGLFVLVRAVR